MLISKFFQSGGIFIAAAGNTYGSSADFPANFPDVISVGGLLHGKHAYYSAKEKVNRWRNGSMGKDFGTSFAAPRYTNSVIKRSLNAPNESLDKIVRTTE